MNTEIYLGKGYSIDFACGLESSGNRNRGIGDGKREYGKRQLELENIWRVMWKTNAMETPRIL